MDNQETISIVIPFYNVEDQVGYCLDSVINQTDSNYRAICVDDGSTDGTSEILDEYEKKNGERINVVHTENHGLSGARNTGLDHIKDGLVTFVDGDDIISPWYIESLRCGYETTTGAGLVTESNKVVPLAQAEQNRVGWREPVESDFTVVDKPSFVDMVLYEECPPSACAHLARRGAYGNDFFPVGDVYEEYRTIGKLVSANDSFSVMENPQYGYVMRPGSIVNSGAVRPKQVLDYESALSRVREDLFPLTECNSGKIYFEALQRSRIFRLCTRVEKADAEIEGIQKDSRKFIADHLEELEGDRRISRGNKIRFYLLAKNPNLYLSLFNLFDRVKKGIK